jgi:predicted SnoaL-like aldol condensation-catalyzing enzyme
MEAERVRRAQSRKSNNNFQGGRHDSAKRTRRKQRLVTEFYELAINQQKPAEAARKYIEFPYRQHNPEVVDGPDGFVQFISAMQEKHPKLKVVISKVLADDDLVALHVHLTREASDPGLAIAELFRLKNGKIIEHWDVVQPVPAKTASGNSMF